MKFTKMQGIGNDYVYVNCFEENIKNPSKVAKFISDRHFGIGSDGLVLILPSDICDFKMRMINSDGSEAEMCGNAIRCVGKFVFDKGLTKKTEITVETLAGIKALKLHINNGLVEGVTASMGEPILESEKIPVLSDDKNFINKKITVEGKDYFATCVSMGNPHCVVYLNDIDNLDIEKIGPYFENHKLFPKRINTEFVEIINKDTIKMRVWERGAGETLACGTGACAVLVSSYLNGHSNRRATIKLLGGDLLIDWNEKDNNVYMTGSATLVFEGEIKLNEECE